MPKQRSYWVKYCGLRINECYGLKWSNIDFKQGVIKIDRQMQYQDGIIKLVPLKTRNAKRDIVMATPLKQYFSKLKKHHDKIVVELAEQREQHQIFLSDMGNHKISSLELVNSLDDGKIQTVNSMKYHTQKIKAQSGIIFKYHYLRHTYGTRLLKFFVVGSAIAVALLVLALVLRPQPDNIPKPPSSTSLSPNSFVHDSMQRVGDHILLMSSTFRDIRFQISYILF